jgi:hypothetical protein
MGLFSFLKKQSDAQVQNQNPTFINNVPVDQPVDSPAQPTPPVPIQAAPVNDVIQTPSPAVYSTVPNDSPMPASGPVDNTAADAAPEVPETPVAPEVPETPNVPETPDTDTSSNDSGSNDSSFDSGDSGSWD